MAPSCDAILTAVARDLWVLMAELATEPDNRAKLVEGQTLVSHDMVLAVEQVIVDISGRFELPAEFVVPGQDRTSALLDLARTVVRRAERAALPVVAEGSFVPCPTSTGSRRCSGPSPAGRRTSRCRLVPPEPPPPDQEDPVVTHRRARSHRSHRRGGHGRRRGQGADPGR